LVAFYEQRYRDCVTDKNTTLIRYDLQVCLRQVYDEHPDPALVTLAQSLIAEEPDPKYQAKYSKVWKKL
jgi:hypothetical protein